MTILILKFFRHKVAVDSYINSGIFPAMRTTVRFTDATVKFPNGSMIRCMVVNTRSDLYRLEGMRPDLVEFADDYWRGHPDPTYVKHFVYKFMTG